MIGFILYLLSRTSGRRRRFVVLVDCAQAPNAIAVPMLDVRFPDDSCMIGEGPFDALNAANDAEATW